jgi:hypothetical protein
MQTGPGPIDTVVKEQTEKIQTDWNSKLKAFNKKVPKPDKKPVEFIQEEHETIPHVDLKSQKKTEVKEIVTDNEPSVSELLAEGFAEEQKARKKEEKEEERIAKKEAEEKKIAGFEQRMKDEAANLERIAKEAKEEKVEEGIPNYIEPPISNQIEEVMDPERTRPDFTEVLEPEVAVKEMMTDPKQVIKDEIKIEEGEGLKRGNIGAVVVDKGKVIEEQPAKAPKIEEPELDSATMTDFERTGILNKFHQEHGKYEDIDDTVLKKERDDTNKAQFLADVALTEEEARNHPPMTESRKAYFQDHIDDVLRGNMTAEQFSPDIAKTVALLLSDYPDPPIEAPAPIPQDEPTVEIMSTEQLKEKFAEKPSFDKTRDATDKELDKLLEGFGDEKKEEPNYIQNEEQDKTTTWNKIDLPEPEKNELELPEIKSTDNIIEYDKDIDIVASIPKPKFTKYKNRIATDEDYHQKIGARIDNLITKLENEEIKLNDLTEEDQKVIMDIMNQNG